MFHPVGAADYSKLPPHMLPNALPTGGHVANHGGGAEGARNQAAAGGGGGFHVSNPMSHGGSVVRDFMPRADVDDPASRLTAEDPLVSPSR